MSAIARGHGSVYQFAEGCRCARCCIERDERVAVYTINRRAQGRMNPVA